MYSTLLSFQQWLYNCLNYTTSKQELNLRFNNLTKIPTEIFQNKYLQKLYLSNNQLSSLPPEIGQLQNLQKLYLVNNHLSSLPPEISKLHNLEELWLYGNQLSSLPPEIGQLQNLKYLYLKNNQLTILPPEIGQLNLWIFEANNILQDEYKLYRYSYDPTALSENEYTILLQKYPQLKQHA